MTTCHINSCQHCSSHCQQLSSCCNSVSLLHICGFVLLTSYARICTDIHLASALVNSISLNQWRSYPPSFQSGLRRRSQYSPMPPCTSHWSVHYLLNYLFWLVKGIKCVCITIIIAYLFSDIHCSWHFPTFLQYARNPSWISALSSTPF